MKRSFWIVAGFSLPWVIWTLAHLAWGGVLVPSPWSTVALAVASLAEPVLWRDIGLTFFRAGSGFFLALGTGLALGLKAGRPGTPHEGLSWTMNLLQAAPALLWSIPLLLVFGTGGGAPMAVSFVVSLPLVYFLAQSARRAIPRSMADVFALYAPSFRMRFREMLRPALSASLRPAVSVGFALSVKSAVIGEWFGARDGFGRRIQTSHAVFDMEAFYADTLVFVGFILLLGWGAKIIAERWFPERVGAALPQDQTVLCRDVEGRLKRPGSQVRAEGLAFSYAQKQVLFGLDFHVEPGKTLLVTGPSGSGKTTLARLLTGLLSPGGGCLERSGRAAMVFQDDGLLGHRDALGNAALPLWEICDQVWRSKALTALEQVGLCEPGLFPSEMSGGMRKRLALARALTAEVDLLVLDEPFVNLHPEARSELWELVFRIQAERGFTLVVVSHYPEEVWTRADNHLSLH